MSLLSERPLTNYDIRKIVKKMKIPHFRGVYMRDTLPIHEPWKDECMVINHDSIQNTGTHWSCYIKKSENVFYFDSFGKLPPPVELIVYLRDKYNIYYNYKRYQQFNTNICGHLCLRFIYEFYRKINEIRNI